MQIKERFEARICESNNALLLLPPLYKERTFEDFCGIVLRVDESLSDLPNLSGKTVYVCGDMSRAFKLDLSCADRVFMIRDLSYGYSDLSSNCSLVDEGQLPILIHGVGVYYRRFFNPDVNYFERISTEHAFQSLTESNKPCKAHRTGIYLTPVDKDEDGLHFRLLRCSTNLSGPTENFQATDWHIVNSLNQEARYIFEDQAPLNHVLAQIYHNTAAGAEQKQSKAKISAHSDKTKDMPANGIMAFCTFYDQLDKLRRLSDDEFDFGHKERSGLTRLRFRLKDSVVEPPASVTLPRQFTVTLYPNSVFFMPLSTNRFYTHEIQSSILDADMLPTRLGYVVRCSNTEAVHKESQTFLKRTGKLVPLEAPTDDGLTDLRSLYAQENTTQEFVVYGDKFPFSMNQGDYMSPAYHPADEFRSYLLPTDGNLFPELLASVRLEDLGKGRQGAVLSEIDSAGCIPVVRTTTKYGAPIQRFLPIHKRLASRIRTIASLSMPLNNALIEKYTESYTTMGAHSDQALDLASDSYIALFSCYEHPELADAPRMLIVESKEAGGIKFEIPLTHNSVIVFSLKTNRRFKHKIVLPTKNATHQNQWLGITFRTSKTLVQFRGPHPYFLDGERLILANDEQSREFYALRSRENSEIDFTYPSIFYTISESDVMAPDDGK